MDHMPPHPLADYTDEVTADRELQDAGGEPWRDTDDGEFPEPQA